MMMASVSNTNKRKRDSDIRLTDITDALKINVASYLPQPSCISFALAVSNSHDTSYEEPSALCMAIASAAKESSIDMKDIQDILGRSLTDDDVRWVLIAIDAVNNIKSLKLTNCFALVGSGLTPLTGSVLLERIDLSLVGDHENPDINPEPLISVSVVVPILHSIIAEEGNELVHVQLPKKWRVERDIELGRFLAVFDMALRERSFTCSNEMCPCPRFESTGRSLIHWYGTEEGLGGRYGMNGFSCYNCIKHFCADCYDALDFCNSCEKYYCNDCANVANRCGFCSTKFCDNCDGVEKSCDRCEEALCQDCVAFTCQRCSEIFCEGCTQWPARFCRLSRLCEECDLTVRVLGPDWLFLPAREEVGEEAGELLSEAREEEEEDREVKDDDDDENNSKVAGIASADESLAVNAGEIADPKTKYGDANDRDPILDEGDKKEHGRSNEEMAEFRGMISKQNELLAEATKLAAEATQIGRDVQALLESRKVEGALGN